MLPSNIPFFGLTRQYAALKDELLAASDKAYTSGRVLDGVYTAQFEEAIAKRTNRQFAIAVNSCSAALLFSYLFYLNLGKKNVVLPALSFIATANAVELAKCKLKFVDVDYNGLMDISKLTLKDDNIDIVSYVNLYGNVLDYNKLAMVSSFFNDTVVIEDAAQSFGATYNGIPSGKLGNVSCLSFDPTKNLPNFGSGGMILTDDEELNTFARCMRNNGVCNNAGLQSSIAGTNSKMSESDCAQMLVKLKYFDQWQARRAKIAQFYTECLYPYVDCPTANPNVLHAWHKYVIRTADQAGLRVYLDNAGVETRIHYCAPLSQSHNTPNAATLSATSISLPIYPELADSEVCRIVDLIQKFYD